MSWLDEEDMEVRDAIAERVERLRDHVPSEEFDINAAVMQATEQCGGRAPKPEN